MRALRAGNGDTGALGARGARWTLVLAGLGLAVLIPAALSDFQRSLASDAVLSGMIVLSLVLLTGFVGQISFCQYSFAAIGAFTVGALVGGHHWSFWPALAVGVLFAAFAGVLVGIPALRLSGLFLAILTVGVALLVDSWLLSPGTWDSFSGGVVPWHVGRPGFLGIDLGSQYAFYLVVLGIFALTCAGVWNLRTGKTGRVLRAIRESEVAAATVGLDLTAWKLAAFAVSAGLAGLAGGLLAASVGSVSAGSYDFLHSVSVAAAVTVFGVESVTSAAAAGIFLVWGPEWLNDYTPLSTRYFQLILGALLVLQLVYTPEGVVTDAQRKVGRIIRSRLGGERAPATELPTGAAMAGGR
jgi:ABC-type branched-subunit amino acid transport system permease subunit